MFLASAINCFDISFRFVEIRISTFAILINCNLQRDIRAIQIILQSQSLFFFCPEIQTWAFVIVLYTVTSLPQQ
jgi:hypothetical protein